MRRGGGVGGGVCSGLVGLTPNVARTLYYHEAEAGANSFSTVGKWFTETNGGGTVSTTPPLMQDTAKFNADSFDAGSKTVTQDMPRIGSVDWTGATNVPTWTTSGTASCFGSITLITATTGMILTASTQAYTFEGRGLYTLTSAGNSWAKAITLNAPTGTLTQQDAFSSTAAITITNGTWAGGTYDLTATTGSNAGTVSGTGTWSFTSTGTIWSNTGTISFSGSHILKATNNSATTKTLSFGTSKTYINLWLAPSSGAGEFDITATTGTTFSDFKDDGSAAHAIKFTKATTTTVSSWNVGTASARAGNTNVITLDTVDGLGTFTLTKTGGGGIVCTRLNITRSTAGGTGALWWAGPAPPSTNGGTNSGWLFTAPPQVLLYGIGGY